MIKTLITGGAGFIGFHLAKLLASNQQVTICDNLSRGKLDLELRKFIASGKVQFIQCDLTKIEELSKLGTKYDCVYHLAAINGTKYFYEKPDMVLRVNTLSSINVLDWFVGSGSKKILFSSSSETYAGTLRRFGAKIPTAEDVPLVVDDVHNPRWSYGASKILGELLFINYARVHHLTMSIVRFHNIYGPRMGFEHVIPEFCLRIFKEQNPFIINGGKETRSFCYIDDAIQATKLVMESTKTVGEIVNIGNSSEEVTISHLADLMFDIANFHPKVKILAAPPGSVARRCPDINKLKKLTTFYPKISLRDGLKATFKWYRINARV